MDKITSSAVLTMLVAQPKSTVFMNTWGSKSPRMGSFTSTPKIANDDQEDDDLVWDAKLTRSSLLDQCHRELCHLPAHLKREWTSVRETDPDTPTFRVVQWNLLSQTLGYHKDNFVCCPTEALEWGTRRFRIIEEILSYMPDIVCLQEVDHYSFIRRAMEPLNYGGTFFPKPDSPCVYIPGNNGPDGCAIFFNKDIFELVSVDTRIVEVWHVQSNQVVILVILKHRQTGQEVAIATTHLKARSGALLSTLRNEQGKDILEFLSLRVGSRPVIITGDFNAEPSELVYRTITSDPRLPFNSAYTHLNGQEPPFTTWKIREEGEISHTLDYIFYTRDKLNVTSLLNMPTGEELGEGRAPSFSYPSDHFTLGADLQFR